MAYDGAARSDKAVLANFLASAGFNRDDYLAHNPDLAHFDDDGLLEHMLVVGLTEHRRLPLLDPFEAANAIQRLASHEGLATLLAPALASEMVVAQRNRFGLKLTPEEIDAGLGLERLGVRPFLIVGDSHSEAYAQPVIARAGLLPLWLCCPGASAKGLAKSVGRSEKIQRFMNLAPNAATICMFGQVDLEFCHIYRCLIAGRHSAYTGPEFQIEMSEAIGVYDTFLSALDRDVVVAGVLPTAVSDRDLRESFARAQIGFLMSYPGDLRTELERLSIPAEEDRNRHHLDFNRRLGGMGRRMLQPSSAHIGHDGLLRQDLRRPVDHHMCFETASFSNLEALSAALA